MLRKGFAKNEEAVSPVIGVILMVAITVILAAVIASFVFGLGSNAPKSAPSAQLSMSDASDSLDDSDQNQSVFTVSHQGGDSLKCSELKIFVYNGSSNLQDTITYDGTSFSGDDLGIVNETTSALDNDRLEPGEIITFKEGGTYDVTSGDVLNIKVLHKPSNQPILDGEVQVW